MRVSRFWRSAGDWETFLGPQMVRPSILGSKSRANFAGFTCLTRAQVELFTRVWGGVDFLKWMVISGKTYFAASFETNYRKSDGLRHCNRNLTGEKLTLLK
jgi:hypothetical protein